MNVPVETLHEQLPLAADIAGVDTAALIALAGLAAGAVSIKKLTPHWHDTIHDSYRGVLFHRGQPVPKNVGSPKQLKGHELPDRIRQRQHRYFPAAGHFVTEEELDAGYGKFVILPPEWYLIGPFYSIQKVNVADQPAEIKIPYEAREKGHLKQLDLHAEIAWHIDPTGDSPLHAITKIQHEMDSKKDTEEEKEAKQQRNMEVKTQRVTALSAPELSRSLSELDMEAADLCDLPKNNPKKTKKVEGATIKYSRNNLAQYGFVLNSVRIVAITRVGEEVTGDSFGRARVPPGHAAAIASRREPDEDGMGEVIPGPWSGGRPAA